MNIEKKRIEKQLIIGLRVKDRYEEMGKYIGELAMKFGQYIAGAPFALYYDKGYKEIADYEICFPIREEIDTNDYSVRYLDSGDVISLMHKGAYEGLIKSWEKIFEYIEKYEMKIKLPTREIYLTDPCREKPENYLTEIQIFLED